MFGTKGEYEVVKTSGHYRIAYQPRFQFDDDDDHADDDDYADDDDHDDDDDGSIYNLDQAQTTVSSKSKSWRCNKNLGQGQGIASGRARWGCKYNSGDSDDHQTSGEPAPESISYTTTSPPTSSSASTSSTYSPPNGGGSEEVTGPTVVATPPTGDTSSASNPPPAETSAPPPTKESSSGVVGTPTSGTPPDGNIAEGATSGAANSNWKLTILLPALIAFAVLVAVGVVIAIYVYKRRVAAAVAAQAT